MGDDGLRGFMRDVNKEGDLDKRDLNKGNAKKTRTRTQSTRSRYPDVS